MVLPFVAILKKNPVSLFKEYNIKKKKKTKFVPSNYCHPMKRFSGNVVKGTFCLSYNSLPV